MFTSSIMWVESSTRYFVTDSAKLTKSFIIMGGYQLMVTICLHTVWFWDYQVWSSRKKTLQTFPEISCTIIYVPLQFLLLWELHSTLLTLMFSFLSSYLHLSLQTVKYLFPVGDFYLLLRYVLMSDNINLKHTYKYYIQTVFCDAILFVIFLQCLRLVRWFSMKQVERPLKLSSVEIMKSFYHLTFFDCQLLLLPIDVVISAFVVAA